MNKLNEILFGFLGFFLSINQGFMLVIGTMNDGSERGSDILMPMDLAIYGLLLNKRSACDKSKYGKVSKFVIKLVWLFLFWTMSGEFVAFERAEFRFNLVHLIRALLLFHCILTRLNKKSEIEAFVKGLLYGLGFQSVIGVWQWQIGPVSLPFFDISNSWRSSGTIGVANAFGVYLISLLPLAIRVSLFSEMKNKIIWMIITALALASLFASFVRGAWLAFIFSMAIFVFIDFKNKKLNSRQITIFLVLTLVLIAVITLKYGHVVTNRMSESKKAIVSEDKHSRMGLAMDAIRIINDHKIFGVGLDNYRYYSDKETLGTRIVHNLYLLIAAQQGVFALVIFLIIHFVIFSVGLNLVKSKDKLIYQVGSATLTSMLAVMIYHMVAPDYRLSPVLIQHWRLPGMIIALLIADDLLKNNVMKIKKAGLKKKFKMRTIMKKQVTAIESEPHSPPAPNIIIH